jgi:hypothetical protein
MARSLSTPMQAILIRHGCSAKKGSCTTLLAESEVNESDTVLDGHDLVIN